MLLKKTANRFVLKKNPKRTISRQRFAPRKKGAARLFRLRSRRAVLLLLSIPAFAASDPLGVVNNLSDFIFSLIRAIGSSFWAGAWCRSASPSRATIPPSVRRVSSPWPVLVITFAKEILDLITA